MKSTPPLRPQRSASRAMRGETHPQKSQLIFSKACFVSILAQNTWNYLFGVETLLITDGSHRANGVTQQDLAENVQTCRRLSANRSWIPAGTTGQSRSDNDLAGSRPNWVHRTNLAFHVCGAFKTCRRK